jgi:hypothetical protein
MTDDLHAAIVRALQNAKFGLDNKILLCATNLNVEQIAAWIEQNYLEPGEDLDVIVVEVPNGQAIFWFLDGVRTTPKRLRAELAIAGILAVLCTFTATPMVYCPPVAFAQAKAARWN